MSQRKTLEILAEEFAARYRRGERPPLSEYIDAHPKLAAEIRELFPTLVMIEELAPSDSGSAVPALALPTEQSHPSLGEYRLLREIGRGGMGIVYEAEQLSLGRRVALKVLRYASGDATVRQRFRREARAAAQLHHTNIVPVFEIGESQDACWYAMQLILGQGLDQIIEEVRHQRQDRSEQQPPLSQITQAFISGQFTCPSLAPSPAPGHLVSREPKGSTSPALPFGSRLTEEVSASLTSCSELSAGDSARGQYYRSVARIGRQAAEALAHAHTRGIIHRDVKPSNLLLDTAGVVWITDFGLAKTQESSLTTTGDIVGTLRYMSPERFKGEGDERADVYGLGLTLYELLVLRQAFAEHDRLQLIDFIKNQEPTRPRSLDRRIPRDLETIILTAIHKEAKRRYQSAESMAEDLRRFLANEPIKARRTTSLERIHLWSRRHPGVASLLTLVFLLLACLTAGSMGVAFWLNEERKGLAAAEADRTEKLYQSLVDQANARRFSRQVGQRYATLEAVRKAAELVRERHMPVGRLDELRNVAIAALVLPDFRTLRTWEGFPGGSFSWDADNQLRRYCRVDMEGNVSLRWIDTDEEIARLQGWRGECWLQFSPDGRFLTVSHDNRQVRVWDVSLAEPHLLGEVEQQGIAFHPDGRHLLVQRGEGALVVFDIQDLKGAPSVLTRLQSTQRHLAYDPSGTRVACIGIGKIEILDANTGQVLSSIASALAEFPVVAWHPSGNYLAWVASDHQILIWDLKRMKRMSVLKGCRSGGIHLAFTPDGERLAAFGWEGVVRLWGWRTGRQLLQLPDMNDFRCCTDGRVLVRGGTRLNLMEFNPDREYRCLVQQSKAGNEIAYGRCYVYPAGRILAVSMSDCGRLFDLDTGDELASVPQGGGGFPFQNTEALLTNGRAGLLRWPIHVDKAKTNSWKLGPPIRLHVSTYPFCLDCDSKGTVIGQAARNRVFLVRPGKSIKFLSPHLDARYLSISPNGKYAVVGDHWGDEGVKVWDTETGKMLILFPVGGFGSGVFSPDGKWLVVGGSRGCRMVKVDTWEERPFEGVGTFSPDSSFMAVPARPYDIRLLEPNTGRELARLADPNQEFPGHLAFSSRGGKLVDSSDHERAIRVWDLRSIRAQLAEMKLDWDAPPLPPAPAMPLEPLQIQVDLGDMERFAEAASLVQQAGSHSRAKKHSEALAALRKAVRLAPSYAMAHNNLAWLLLTGPKKLRDPPQALPLARKAVELEPNQPQYTNTLGVALYYSGQFADAVAVLEGSLREHNGQTDAFDLFFLAMCHHRLGDAVKAEEYHERGKQWFQSHKDKLRAGWNEELTGFQAEADAVLAQPPGRGKK